MRTAALVSSFSTACLLAVLAGPTNGQTSYFSLTGDFPAGGDQYDFGFDLTRDVTSAETLYFRTFGSSVDANAAGNVFANNGYDGDVRVLDGGGILLGQDDESGPGFDALLSFVVDAGTPLPDPTLAGGYTLNVREFNGSADSFAVDLVGPDDALVFTGGSPVSTGVAQSLRFGSNDGGTAVYNHSAGTFNLTGEMIVANTGNAELNLSNGTINTGGLTTINAGGTVNLTGVYNANGLTINANGTLNINSRGDFNASPTGTLNVNANGTLNVTNRGELDATPRKFGTPTNRDGLPGASLSHGGAMQLSGGTVELNGGGGRGGGDMANGGAGGAGGALTADGATIDLAGSALLSLNGGLGGLQGSNFTNGGVGGAGGVLAVNAGSTIDLAGSGQVTLNGGTGGRTGGIRDIGNGGVGGAGGLIDVAGGTVQINNAATLSVRGGAGGDAKSEFGPLRGNGGNGGAGGEVRVSGGSLVLNDGLITIAGGPRGAGDIGAPGQPGAHGDFNITGGGSFTQNGGEVFTGSFQSVAGQFTHNDGKLTVSGGTFDVGVASYTVEGVLGDDLSTLVLADGATAPGLTGNIVVGNVNRGRVEVLSGSTLSTGQVNIGFFSGQGGEVLVDGAGSKWTSNSGGVYVGRGGAGSMLVTNGGRAESSQFFIVGDTSPGTLTVSTGGWVVSEGFFTVSDTPGSAGSQAVINAGGTLDANLDVEIARQPGSAGTLVAEGVGTQLVVGRDMYVGGRLGSAVGGAGELRVQDGAAVVVSDTMSIRDLGAVNFSGGTIYANTIDHTLGGAFNFTGGTLVVDTFDGTLDQDGGILAFGTSPGTTTISADYNLNAGSIAIELAGLTPGVGHDEVIVSGTMSLGASSQLDVSFFDGFVASQGDSFDIFDFGSIANTFSAINLPALDSGLVWDASNLLIDGTLSVITASLSGDYNADGVVDAADYTVWRDNLGAPDSVLPTGSTTDGSGFVDSGDYDTWQANYGQTAAVATPNGKGVPEPSAWILLTLAGTLHCRMARD